jgi:hypothetical protein
MAKYADPTIPTNVKKVRPSNLWTRAVYYEGLMALQTIDPQQRYIDYAMTWADFHKWSPRNGVKTCDADDQCCGQTYIELLPYIGTKDAEHIKEIRENLDYQMQTPNKKNGSLYGWWTWIDAIQMAMPLYMQMYNETGNKSYRDHGMKMYRWSRNECGGGLFNVNEGLWWRDADYVPPYKEPDGKQCYWSRGNGWVYAALVRCMNLLPEKSKEYKELKKEKVAVAATFSMCSVFIFFHISGGFCFRNCFHFHSPQLLQCFIISFHRKHQKAIQSFFVIVHLRIKRNPQIQHPSGKIRDHVTPLMQFLRRRRQIHQSVKSPINIPVPIPVIIP